LELEIIGACQSGRLTMATISHVFTVARVAEMLGEDEEWLDEISIEMDPEDGRIIVWGRNDETMTAFTELGIENLANLVEIYKASSALMARSKQRD